MTPSRNHPDPDNVTGAGSWWQQLPRLLHEPPEPARMVELLRSLLPGASRVVAQFDGREASSGATAENQETISADIVVLVPRGRLEASVPPTGVAEGSAVLSLTARLLEQRLALEELTAWRQRALDLVTAGEAVGSLVHSVNNHINSMLMQGMVIKLRAEGDVAARLDAIHQEGKQAAARLRPVQSLRPWAGNRSETADLVTAVRRVLAAEPELARRVQVRLLDRPVPIHATREGLERMVGLLLRVGVRCLPAGASATLAVDESSVALELPVQGEPGESGSVDLPPELWAGIGELEREAVRWLARQMGARAEAEPVAGGLAWRIHWPA